jgi:acyl-CoA hydrolase
MGMTTAPPAEPARRARDSLTTMTEHVLPTHANSLGTVFGGQVLAWIDLCAAICAQRFTGHLAVTAEFDDVTFAAPIKVGQVVLLRATVTAAFKTSVEIFVEVEGEDAPSGRRWPCAHAFVTFVAVEEREGALRPTTVPTLLCETDEARELAEAATERRRQRLERRRKERRK